MRKTAFLFGILIIASFWIQANAQPRPDEKLFQDAKILIFDEKWGEAQQKLDEFISKFPESPYYAQALFYRGKCLRQVEGKEKEALAAYEEYLRQKERSQSLVEESEYAIVDLAFELCSQGEKSYLREIEERLESPNKVIKYYAAFKLSYAKDKQAAARAVPTLKQIISEEKDAELRDRAKIYLLRVSPDALRDIEQAGSERKVRILKIRVEVIGQREPALSINIPWALADLALGALSDKDKAAMRERGYDIDKTLRDLTRAGSIIEIRSKDRIIRIWID